VRNPGAYRLYLLARFVLALPAWVVVAVYLVRVAKLDPLQLVLMGTVMEAAVFVFEVPTGVVADVVSRRLSFALGWLLQGSGWALAGATKSFGLILVAWIVWGIGATLESGAFEAWITDEVGPENVGRAFLRGTQAMYLGGLVGLLASVGLATWNIQAAIYAAGGVTIAMGIAALLVFPETGFHPKPRDGRSHGHAMLDTTRTGLRLVRRAPALVLLVTTALFAGAASEGYDRLWEAHFLRDIGVPKLAGLDPLWWFAVLGVGTMLLGLFAVNGVARHLAGAAPARMASVLVVLSAVQVAAMLGFALASAFALAVATVWIVGLARSLIRPVYSTWLNQAIEDSSVRATVNSIASQSDAIGEVAGGPAVGAIGKALSIPAALVTSGLLLTPAIALYARAVRHDGTEPEFEELPQTVQAGA
jgi:DHA3 family tetracycline resistance protein-like MFS transporter